VKEATGLTAATETVLLAIELPALLLAVKVALNVPALVNLCVTLLPEAVTPSPKLQLNVLGELVLVLVNVQVVDVDIPDAGDIVNEATGFTTAVPTTTDFVALEFPAVFPAVSVTL
jgi:hypothetical protein